MAEGPDPGRSREALEELVYRPALGGGAVRGASPWLTVPVTLALAGALAGLALLAGRRTEEGREPVSVSVVLQEAPDAPARAAAAAPAAPRAPAPPAPAAPAAPAPLVQPPAPAASAETAPDTPPRDLPREDHSRQAGGALSAAPGGAGAGPGAQAGTGAAGPGGPAAKVLDLESTQVKIKFRPPPPDYPALARRAGVQGTVVVQILVGPDGVPVSARALEGPFMLRAAAEAYALAWRFHPPLVNGVPQASRFTLTMPFTLK